MARWIVIALASCTSASSPPAIANESVPRAATSWASYANELCRSVHAPARVPALTGVVLDMTHVEQFEGGVLYKTKGRSDIGAVAVDSTGGVVSEEWLQTKHPVAELCASLGLEYQDHDDRPWCMRLEGSLRLVVSRDADGTRMWCEWLDPRRAGF
jgi:hypothetical protein